MIIAVALCYIVILGGMALLRREGLSNQFAFEVLGFTALAEAGAWLSGTTINPILFLVVLYLVSMRGRLLVDLATLLSGRGRQRDAISMMQLALRLYPDRATRLIVLVNMGIVQLRRQNPAGAERMLQAVLDEASQKGGLGAKYESACHYHLGLACQRLNNPAEAVLCFNRAIEAWPASIYARAAERALEQRRRGKDRGGQPAG
jgi:tetratricopeptide (TPR) repeat protein